MNRPFIASLVLILAACLTGVAVQHITEHPPHVAPPAAEVTAPPPLAAVGGDSEEAATDLIVAFGEGVRREQERIAADEMAALEAARPRSGSGSVATGSYGGDCAALSAQFGLPESVLWRESRCSTDAYNERGCGGRGCIGPAQLDAGHFAPVSPWNPAASGGCSDLDPASIDDQATCASRLAPSAWG